MLTKLPFERVESQTIKIIVSLPRWSNYLGASWVKSANTFKAPVNASVFYDQPRYRLALNGYSLLNERYWKSIGTPQKSVNMLVRVTFKW
ncbi:iron complex outermembrane recepter protein [Dyadobacter sp. SG02]|uniref:hypothetical protein n=1 Tax=Dyadobacter sp. SG02 TaxID=1855291 RepID=UPI0008BE4C53|nr:hypothetical protein [Dyadobacter sp. SG02]SEI40298.1 iron complex outermembrane recepter protein [Dyadobacter sp. SG02]